MNQKLIFILLIIFLFTNSCLVYAQEDLPPDSTINLEELNPDEFVYTPDYEIKASYGWFPVPVDNYFNLSLEWMGGDISDLASWISPSGFVKTKFPYTGNNPLSGDEREIMRANENLEVEDEEYPETDNLGIGFHAIFNIKLPLIFRIHTTLSFNEGMLFSLDETKSYLNYNGNKNPFKEASIVYQDEIMLNAGIDCLIPFYGAFAKLEVPIQTYYYLSFGINFGYTISSLTTQYSQIVDAKDFLRYNNGQDTVHLITERTLSDLNYSRYHANIGLGFEFDIARIGFGMEFYVSVPLNSVVKDALWKQYVYGLKTNINFMGLFDL
ncbi:MAG: hypothetical protein A2220_09685 [Ignavibacteria bacterium RIFOXYA2_FULL_35_10]|nr:MAG: hypothetical protein A2220_09685 [Ignavibacteria bacterium RIFOXYA2_FULL_35_10]